MSMVTLRNYKKDFISSTSSANSSSKYHSISSVSSNIKETTTNRNGTSSLSLLKDVSSLAIKILTIAIVTFLIFTFIYGIHHNNDPGMYPAVKDGDMVLYYRLDKKLHSGDLVLVSYNNQLQVRRVVAVEGDTVDIKDDGLYINGAYQQSSDTRGNTYRYEGGAEFPLTVQENMVFVLGDSRELSIDSRIYKEVSIKDTHGKVISIFRRRSL